MHKVIQGISQLEDTLLNIACKKLFLVVGSSYVFLNIKKQIDAIDIEKVVFSNFTPNPIFEQIIEGINLLENERCDAILAVGGGSAIDVAKCIKLAILSKEGKEALIPPLVSIMVDIPESSVLPMIAIPTTAGTGSESTHNAVMYYNGEKQTVTNDAILPDIAILEPTVLTTLPVYQKKCTMMDALCQGIESWWSVNSTYESREYSKMAVKLIMLHWKAYIYDNDIDAMKQIMIAANYAGKAINIAQTTAAHAMSYKITSLYKFPHGHAVAICLPEIWEYMLQNMDRCCDARGQKYLKQTFDDIACGMGTHSVKEAIGVYRDMMDKMELSLFDVQMAEDDLTLLSSSINPVRLKNNPVLIGENDALELYSRIIK